MRSSASQPPLVNGYGLIGIHGSRYEAYDRVEGSARIAEANAHAGDDGVIDRKEAKALKEEKNHQLNMRHRGVMQYQAVR
jgi:hypothetical protein